MLDLDPQLTAVLALSACAAAAALAIVVVLLALRVRRLGRLHRRAFGGSEGEDVMGLLGRHEDTIASLRSDVQHVDARANELRSLVAGTVSRVGLIRYDAFEDMGGALSFSAALLDEHGDGIVVSAINGRTETRCYGKAVSRGVSDHHLSAEEEAAIDTAVAGGGLGQAPPVARRGRRRTS